jgi:hypothetical protein
MFLSENIKRFGMDLLSLSRTAENIQDAFKTLLHTSYGIDSAQSNVEGDSADYAKYFYKSSAEAFSAISAHMA